MSSSKKEVAGKRDPLTGFNVRKSDMPDAMLHQTADVTREAVQNFKLEKDIANEIKKKMDLAFPGASWHVLVGKHFGMALTHETTNLAFFSHGGFSICIFKAAEFA